VQALARWGGRNVSGAVLRGQVFDEKPVALAAVVGFVARFLPF
jgi:hypothetical protein